MVDIPNDGGQHSPCIALEEASACAKGGSAPSPHLAASQYMARGTGDTKGLSLPQQQVRMVTSLAMSLPVEMSVQQRCCKAQQELESSRQPKKV